MYRIKRRTNRAVSNIIATLVIFTVMLLALSLAFSQILPSVERFQSNSQFAAATNTFYNFDSSIKRIINAPDNDSELLRYELSDGSLDIINTNSINISIISQSSIVFSHQTVLGELKYTLNGRFSGDGGKAYDIGDPLLMVYSVNRTTHLTNIIHQTMKGYMNLLLYYDIFLSIDNVKEDVIQVNFLIIHLNTTRSTNTNQEEYFPIIDTQSKILITKQSHTIDSYYVGNYSTDLKVEAESQDFAQTINYAEAPTTTFALYVNIININIDFKAI